MAARRTMVRTLSGIGIGVMLSAGAALAAGTGQADAAPNIHCAGQICHNYGDQIGIGFGTYQCPNGIQYPSFAVVPPFATAAVYPANCGGVKSLY